MWKVGASVTGGINSQVIPVEPGKYRVQVYLDSNPRINSGNSVVVEIKE